MTQVSSSLLTAKPVWFDGQPPCTRILLRGFNEKHVAFASDLCMCNAILNRLKRNLKMTETHDDIIDGCIAR